jgi:hypothetical protein
MLSSLEGCLALYSLRYIFRRQVVKKLLKSLISLSLVTMALTGCVVAPVGWHRGYYGYGPRAVVVAPAPVVVVRP